MVKHEQFNLYDYEEETVLMEFTEEQFWTLYGTLASEQENIKNVFKLMGSYPKLKEMIDVSVLINDFNSLEELLRIFDVEVQTEEDPD